MSKKREIFTSLRTEINGCVYIIKITDISSKRAKYLYTISNGKKELSETEYKKLTDNEIIDLIKTLFKEEA